MAHYYAILPVGGRTIQLDVQVEERGLNEVVRYLVSKLNFTDDVS